MIAFTLISTANRRRLSEFPLLHRRPTEEQIRETVQSVDQFLKDDKIGYRLNSRFGGIQQNLGRAFGFAFGHKENGAMFSHMTVMYANALYKRGFVREGRTVLESVYELSSDFERSRIYPGIPEYINAKGRGMYHFLTGFSFASGPDTLAFTFSSITRASSS